MSVTVTSLPSFYKPLKDVACFEGTPVILECYVRGYPLPEIRWERAGKLIGNSRNVRIERDGGRCRLFVKVCTQKESGKYTCLAQNKEGLVQTSAIINVYTSSASLKRSQNGSSILEVGVLTRSRSAQGDRAGSCSSRQHQQVTRCCSSSPERSKGSLRKDDIVTSNGSMSTTLPSNGIKEKDGGVKNGNLSSTKSSNGSSVHPPCFLQPPRRNKVMAIGECARFSCCVTGAPRPTVRWEKKLPAVNAGSRSVRRDSLDDGHDSSSTAILDSADKGAGKLLSFSQGSVHILEVRNVSKEDSGIYMAVAENCFGKAEASVRLEVKAPRQISTNHGNSSKYASTEKLPQRSLGASKSPSATSHPVSDDVRGNERSVTAEGGNKNRRQRTREKSQNRSASLDTNRSNATTTTAANFHEKRSSKSQVYHHQREKNLPSGPRARNNAISVRNSTHKKHVYRATSVGDKPKKQTSTEKERTAIVGLKNITVDTSSEFLKQEDSSTISTPSPVAAIASPPQVHEQNKIASASPRLPGESFTQELEDVRVSDGESVTLTAGIQEGFNVQDVLWLRNNQEVADCPNFRHFRSNDKNEFSLVIADVFPEDSGDYACVITTSDGQEFQTKCRLDVKANSPLTLVNVDINETKDNALRHETISEEHHNKSTPQSELKTHTLDVIEERQDSVFKKELDSQPDSTETKEKENKDIGDGDFCNGNQTDPGLPADLLITNEIRDGTKENLNKDSTNCVEEAEIVSLNVLTDDVSCARDDARVLLSSSPRVHRYTPAQILKGPQSLAVLRGENITLRTHFIGTAPVKITWIKGGKILHSSDRINITVEEGMSVLTIRDVMADDSGKYVVSVENGGGSDCHFASVAVEGPPYPPTGKPTVSDVTTHSLTVSWYGSAYDGGSVITGYIVEMCVLPDIKWNRISASCHSTSYHVRDLLPNRQYLFRVRAENVHGVSEPGMESEPILLTDDAEDEKELEDFAPFEHRVVEIDDTSNFEDYYELKEEVGKGRFGVVYKCTELSTGEDRAAKIIRCVKSRDKQKVHDEIAIMNRLRHPKLVQLAAAFEKPREIVLVTEFISGGELFERVIADDFVLTERDCILFMQQICEGVRYMHNNYVIHLDLKPENILCKTQTSHQIKIIDFGLARIYNPAEKLHVLFGTPEFVAPEVISYEPVSLASDMWSLGVICYVLLSGLSPFMGDTDTETFSNITRAEFDFDDEAFDEISDDAKEFISLLLLKIPEKRMTAEECLKHKWLAQERHKMKGIQLSTDKLKKFIIRRKWQKTGNAIRALGRIQSLSGYSSGRSTLGSYSSYSSMTSDTSDASSGATNNSSNCVPKHHQEVIKEHEEDAYYSGGSCQGDFEDNKSDKKSLHSYKKSHADSDYASVEAPSFVKPLSKTQRVLNGQNVVFEVQVDGGPDPDVIWLKSDVVLESNDKHRIQRNPDGICTLEINDCQEDDEDEYTCIAFNSAGHVSSSVVLHVDPPETDPSS